MKTYSYKEIHEVVESNQTYIAARLNTRAEGFEYIKQQVKEFGFTWDAENLTWIYKGEQKEKAMSFLKGLVNKDNVWSALAKQEEDIRYGITKNLVFLRSDDTKVFEAREGNTKFIIANNESTAIKIYRETFGYTAEKNAKAILESDGLFRIIYL